MEYDAFADALVAGAKTYIDGKFAAILQRLAVLEARPAPEPVAGVGVQSAIRNADGELVFILTDGKMLPIGSIDGKDGKDAAPVNPADIARMIDETVARLPPAEPGKDAPAVSAEAVAAVLKAEIEPVLREVALAAVAALPKAVDGVNGADADMGEVQRFVASEVTRQIAEMPPPEIEPIVARSVAAAVAALPPAKDGVGVTGALIDREGRLVLTLADGTVKELGVVVGKDADMAALADICVREIENIPRPRDGIDGLGFDDVQVVHDGERQVTIRFARGEHVKEFALTIPAIIDRGIWREGRFAKGDGVTWDGSFFIAQCDTTEKPLLHQDWRQAVKAGRPGKNTETVKYLPASVKLADNATP